PLGGGGAVAKVAEVELPAGLATGSYTLHVLADAPAGQPGQGPAWGAVYERDAEANNSAAGAPFAVQAYPATDLAVGAVTAPTTALAGDRVAVSWTVRNGPAATTLARSWADRVLLSADDDPSADDAVLATVARTGALAPSATYSAGAQVTIPESATGPLRLLVVADAEGLVQDPSRTNNVAVRTVAVTPPTPVNLVVEAVTAASTGVAGQPLAVTFTVRNAGDGPTRDEAWTDDVYVSPTADAAGAIPVGRVRHTGGPLAAGVSYTVQTTVDVPFWLATGTYYVVAGADGGKHVYERDAENDNHRATPISVALPLPADLVVSSVTTPEHLWPGTTARVVYEVTNAGANRAKGQATDAVYVSDDETWDPSDPLLTAVTRQIDLAPGALLRQSVDVDAARLVFADARGIALADTVSRLAAGDDLSTPTVLDGTTPGLPLGPHYLLVRTDVRNNIREVDDANNTTPTDESVEVEVPLLAAGDPVRGDVYQDTEWYARFEATGGESVELVLDSDHTGRAPLGLLEVFVRHEATPSRAAYDVAYANPRSYNQRVVIADALPGTYYVAVRGATVFPAQCPAHIPGGPPPGSPPLPAGCDPQGPSVDIVANFTLTARTLGFVVESVEGSRIGDRGQAS
ncbi:MAG TPA: CARDB domain-containing protein, partial [Rubricoccaceae bacterium]